MFRTGMLVAFASAMVLVGSARAQTGADLVRDEIAALEAPKYDASRREDPDYRAEYSRAYAEYSASKAALAAKLYGLDPESEDAQKLMTERWSTLSRQGDEGVATVLAETAAAASGDSEFATNAAYLHASTFASKHRWEESEVRPVLEAFVARAPEDERSARLLYGFADAARDDETRVARFRELIARFPDARSSKYAGGKIRQVEGMGRPFELAFQDAVTGETVDLQAQRGTIYVIDFWATWCGPCIAEMPHMKELYAEYKDRGVQFIGVSLDQAEDKGGLTKLLEYVETNEIGWPQYYQGAYWDGEFSRAWGINSIPSLFVVDHEGNLHSTSARGQLERMIPELIDRREQRN